MNTKTDNFFADNYPRQAKPATPIREISVLTLSDTRARRIEPARRPVRWIRWALGAMVLGVWGAIGVLVWVRWWV